MNKEKCIVCGQTQLDNVFEIQRPDFSRPVGIVVCRNCGFIFQSVGLTQQETALYYNREYYQRQTSFLEKMLVLFLEWLVAIEIGKNRSGGLILDIGCGEGNFLNSMKRNGWRTFGIDTSAVACEVATKKLGNDAVVLNKNLEDCGFADNYFDVVTLWHVLEHIENPDRLLTEIRRILKPNGMLVVEVPNLSSPVFKLTKQGYFSFDDPTHLYHFSAKTLNKLIEKNGFSFKKRGCTTFNIVLSLFTSISRRLYYRDKINSKVIRSLVFVVLFPLLTILTLIFGFLTLIRPLGSVLRFYYSNNQK
ncbi:MAG: class I SAM-dependent methyltransferase [Patescibacteria group bacterium]|jgi:2-polyprenyl-3-methyl-5-hydroxy-6-metoxy-1,4-benzoquinol methylase